MVLNFDLVEISGACLLFSLVFGMSASVDIGCMLAQLQNRRAIATGVFLQFVVLPLLGFIVVKSLQMSPAMGITLLVVTSSPGGSYSNWWCSMFNADLALSVTMTAISTLLSTFMLPLNLLLYAKFSYDAQVTSQLDWGALFSSLVIVLSAIGLGLYCSEKFNSHNFNLHANRLGNAAGIALIIFSAVISNSDEESQLWERPWRFYFGVAAPCCFGLLVANIMTKFGVKLLKPERVTVSIECCYQNVGIATSVALTMFEGNELAEAMGVPLYYGLVEMFVLGIYCITAWKFGWTKAPRDVSLYTAVTTSYEIVTAEKAELGETVVVSPHVKASMIGGQQQEEDNNDGFHYIQHVETFSLDPEAQQQQQQLQQEGIEMTVTGVRRADRPIKQKKEKSYIFLTPLAQSAGLGRRMNAFKEEGEEKK